ncbi:MAG: HAD family hydrolase [Clostridia bacterium]|nr:HAD family hydrolase [Clostridia bacterium]
MIKTVAFDVFGTLISTGTGSIDAVKTILNKRKRNDIDAKEFYTLWKKYHRENITEHGFITEEESYLLALKRLYNEFLINGDAIKDITVMTDSFYNRTAFPESKSTVEYLMKRYDVCVASNTDNMPLKNNLSKNGMSFKRIYTSETLRLYKPDRRFYEFILNDLNISENELLFVGDSLIDDVYGPSKVGIKTCHVNRKGTEYTDIMPDFSVSDLNDLLTLVL